MKPIEQLWAILERKILMKYQKPCSRADLLRLLHETWQDISQDIIRELIKSMVKRVLALKKYKGDVDYVWMNKLYSLL